MERPEVKTIVKRLWDNLTDMSPSVAAGTGCWKRAVNCTFLRMQFRESSHAPNWKIFSLSTRYFWPNIAGNLVKPTIICNISLPIYRDQRFIANSWLDQFRHPRRKMDFGEDANLSLVFELCEPRQSDRKISLTKLQKLFEEHTKSQEVRYRFNSAVPFKAKLHCVHFYFSLSKSLEKYVCLDLMEGLNHIIWDHIFKKNAFDITTVYIRDI